MYIFCAELYKPREVPDTHRPGAHMENEIKMGIAGLLVDRQLDLDQGHPGGARDQGHPDTATQLQHTEDVGVKDRVGTGVNHHKGTNRDWVVNIKVEERNATKEIEEADNLWFEDEK